MIKVDILTVFGFIDFSLLFFPLFSDSVICVCSYLYISFLIFAFGLIFSYFSSFLRQKLRSWIWGLFSNIKLNVTHFSPLRASFKGLPKF